MVKLYTTSRLKNCPVCDMAKKFLHKYNVEYEEIDCAVDKEAWNEMFKKTNTVTAPWNIISADRKIYARIKVIQLILKNIPYDKSTQIHSKQIKF